MSDNQNKKITTSFIRSKWIERLLVNLPFVCYLVGLGVFYIFNSHASERSLRKINELKREVKDQEGQLTKLEQSLKYSSTQSQLAKSLEESGLMILNSRPVTLGKGVFKN